MAVVELRAHRVWWREPDAPDHVPPHVGLATDVWLGAGHGYDVGGYWHPQRRRMVLR